MREYLGAVWRCRYFWLSLVKMDLRTRYRRSILGMGWSLLHPIAMTSILCIVFHSIFQKDIASALIYTNSTAKDWNVEELRPYLDKYVRGSNGYTAEQRVKVLKLAWDAIGTDFGSRHELYERNYAGNHEQVQVDAYLGASASGLVDQFVGFVDECMSEYDTNGWTVPDLIDPRTGL